MENFAEKLLHPFNPYYLKILHGNYVRLEGNKLNSFVSSVWQAIAFIDEAMVNQLLRGSWRELLTGSWFAGLLDWSQYTETLGELLIESPTCYAGQGYCFALACFANELSVNYLISYLDKYLPKIDCEYDQDWAMPSLMWIDNLKGTNYSQHYLVPGGLWERFTANKLNIESFNRWDLERQKQHFGAMMNFCEKWFFTPYY